ncbi:MAG: chromosome segregation protein SMC [Eubacteriales bacterium]|nr:chromosome segregation protein SMC [Eubacteriales bacterium]
MYLKSIEVHGFKSFANKMKFQFHNGITGIVGPNGSGKSNVADAVRWVLGEQSAKQLRGSNMQDVIFSGTENRKPLGFASVAITLDNGDHQLPTEYPEVTVTRRLYRSGESEYLINGAVCRLRDIQEMFYDTGIGKEGYSIIGQGQIEKILNGKPEERRELFDEAAGIVKFKRRKMTARKKLEDENNNLLRVNDILSELTRQIGPLEKQSEKAKIYLQKKEELKSNDINMFLLEDMRVKKQLQEVEEKISVSDSDIADAGKRLEDVRSEYEASERELEELNAQIEEKKNAVSQAKLSGQQMESRIELLQEQIRSSRQNDEHYVNRMTAIEAELTEKQGQLENEQAILDGLRGEISEASGREKAAEEELGRLSGTVYELEQAITRGQSSLIDLLNERSNTKGRLQRYETMAEQVEIRKSELAGRLLTARGAEEKLEETGASWKQEYDKILQTIKEMTEKNGAVEADIQKVQEELRQKSAELEEAQTAYHREASRLESLMNLTERYDGYGISIRKVMERKGAVKGIHGVVADLIKTQKKYETAIETALGGSIQNIVTDSEATAKEMIDYLKKNRFGRATFLPLTAIRKRGGLAREQALYEPGALGVASTLVEADDIYEDLVEYLLGQTLVADHIDHAIAIAKKYRHSIRIVTLDGELLSPGGSMSGGAFKNSSNLLGRRRETEELEKSAAARKKHVEDVRGEIDKLRDRRGEYRRLLEEQTEKLQQIYLRQNTARLRLSEIEEQKTRNLSDNEQLKNEAAELENQMNDIRSEQESIRRELDKSVQSEKALEAETVLKQQELEKQRRLLEEKNEAAAQMRSEGQNLRQREEFIGDNLRRVEGEIRRLTEEAEKIQESRRDAQGEAEQKEREIQKIKEGIGQAKEEEAKAAEQMEQMAKRRQAVSEVHKDFFGKREELARQMSDLDKERYRLDNQKERLEDYRDRQINYMWEEYGITASEAADFRDASHENPADLKKRITELKNEIKALGPVNVNAIEEYKEIAKRHAFLMEQHDDLVKAGEVLKGIIAELDSGMRRQFSEKFAIMQKEFSKAFKELFGGGNGTLELVEDEDILEAGIRIIAQPPGKKLQNMMQMSGGEKALTAIALLFAIQNMKPSPFCLLDEIEAALDENNVARYANYLKKLTKNTQFIIITHRRGTMAAADRLYGITMQEKGISTQVSVNMVEKELDK